LAPDRRHPPSTLWGSWYASAQQEHQAEATAAATGQQVAEQNASQTASDMNASRMALQGLIRVIEQIHEAEQGAAMAIARSM
jgi:hypothetical protein